MAELVQRCREGDVDGVKSCVERGIDIRRADRSGTTGIEAAIIEGHLNFPFFHISLKICHICCCIHKCDVVFEIYDGLGLGNIVDADIEVI